MLRKPLPENAWTIPFPGIHNSNILARILQKTSWSRTKREQLQLMLLSSTAFEAVSWVFYYDVAIQDHNDGTKVQYFASCIDRLGTKYFARRVRALWIDITILEDLRDHDRFRTELAEESDRGFHIPFILSTCRNLQHLRINSCTSIDTLLQASLNLPMLKYLTLSSAFHEPISEVSWKTCLSGHPTPAFSTITHFTIELPAHPLWVPVKFSSYLTLFSNLTHLGIQVTGNFRVAYGLLAAASASDSMNSIQKIVFVVRRSAVTYSIDEIPLVCYESEKCICSRGTCSRNMWHDRTREDLEWECDILESFFRWEKQSFEIFLVKNDPKFGSMDEWKTLTLGERLDSRLSEQSFWKRKAWRSWDRTPIIEFSRTIY